MSVETVGLEKYSFSKFLFHDIPCCTAQEVIKTKWQAELCFSELE